MPEDGSDYLAPFSDSAESTEAGKPVAGLPPVTPPVPVVSSPPVVRYAGFWRRVWAVLLDALLLFTVGMASNALMRSVAGVPVAPLWKESSGGTPLYNCLETLVGIAIGWIYAASLESSEKQATVGKMIIGIKVTDLSGRRISFPRATGRHFAQIFDFLTLLVGYAMAGFTAKKQALHDKIAGTLVVRA